MRRFFFLVMVLVPLLSFGQTFTLTPNGLRSADDETKDFVVIPAEGKTADQIYKATKSYINQIMKNPTKSIKADSEGEYIRYSLLIPEFAVISKMGIKVKYEGRLEIEMRFKDNRLRFNVLEMDMPTEDGSNYLALTGSPLGKWVIFKKDGKVAMKDQKAQIENHINGMIAMLANAINNQGGNVVSEDW